MKPRLLDLFCCAGGAGKGYALAGFEVVGVDIKPQPRYPFEFHQADCLALEPAFVRSFDAAHASPPCQKHTSLKTMHNAKEHADLIAPTRALLTASGLPWIMENVPGAPLAQPIMLCGTMFGLGTEQAELRRHRLFEASFPIVLTPECRHQAGKVIGVYGGHARNRIRTIGIYGDGGPQNAGGRNASGTSRGARDFTGAQAREAMGIDWMTGAELSQAIPPAYTEWLGKHLMVETLSANRAAA